MRQLLQKSRYFLATGFLSLTLLAGCERIENTPPTQNDSLAVIPVGPGTRPDALRLPDTPGLVDTTQVDTMVVDTTGTSGAERP